MKFWIDYIKIKLFDSIKNNSNEKHFHNNECHT